MRTTILFRRLLAGAIVVSCMPALAISSKLTYQGHLTDNTVSGPVTGSYDLVFTLQDVGGAVVGTPISFDNASVVAGVFTVELDFGATAFSGADRFLQIGVRRGVETGAFTALTPRSAVTPVPYAQVADSAEFAVTVANDSIGSAQIVNGSVGSADIDASLQRRVSGSCASGTAIATVAANGTVTCESGLQGPIGATGPTGPQGPAGSADAWGRLGNAGTDPATHFIGTTDAQAFEIKADNQRVARFENNPVSIGHTANVVLGSPANVVDAGVRGATVSGGGKPSGASDPDLGVGGPNRVTDHYGSIGGGAGNLAGNSTGSASDGKLATVGGGYQNTATRSSTVGGGESNVSNYYSTVAGGILNTATNIGAVGGGNNNTASGIGGVFTGNATVAGGAFNQATYEYSAIGGGYGNVAFARYSTISGGSDNCAGGQNSWAGGYRAKVRLPFAVGTNPDGDGCDNVANANDSAGDGGTFIWADSQNTDFVSTGPNQFNVRASGGVNIVADGVGKGVDIKVGSKGMTIAGSGGLAMDVASDLYFYALAGGRQMLNLSAAPLASNDYGIGVQNSTLYFRSPTSFAWFEDGEHVPTAYDPGAGGTLQMRLDSSANLHVTGSVNGTVFNPTSDRNAKTAFSPVDTVDILARVLELPLSTWRFKRSTDERHIGPMAQDFHAAFGLNGEDDKHIATVDADGVALAAIQGLNSKLELENAAQDAELAALKRELASLRELLTTKGQ